MRPFALPLVICLAGALNARAEVPLQLTHQGLLHDANDRVVSGSVPMNFRVFDQELPVSAQRKLWEGACTVAVRNGAYAVVLGDGTCGAAIDAASLPPGAPRFLEVSVDGQALLPRLRLSIVPSAASALVAGNAERLGGLAPGAYWQKSEAVEAATLGGKALADLRLKSEPVDATTFGGAPAAAFRLAADPVDAATLDGKAVSAFRLKSEPVEAATLGGKALVDLRLKSEPVDAATLGGSAPSAFAAASALTAFDAKFSNFLPLSGGSLSGQLVVDGSLGIGSASPAAKLDVAGGVRIGNDAGACNAAKAGTLRFVSGVFEGCDGNAWTPLVGARGSVANPGRSCKEILDLGASKGDGLYWLDFDGQNGSGAPVEIWCDMLTDGGGWTLVRVSNGTTSPDLRTEAAVNPQNLRSPSTNLNAQLASATVTQLGTVLMVENTAAGYDTKLWFDRNRACSPASKEFFYTYSASRGSVSSCPSASSIAPPSANQWGQNVGGTGTHINSDASHPLCFGSWATSSKGHFCFNRNSLDWWNYGSNGPTSSNGNAKTALYVR